VEFEGKGTFGEPFSNPYFNFTIFKKEDFPVSPGETYLLEFQRPTDLAIAYKELIQARPSGTDPDAGLITLELTTSNLARDIDFMNRLVKEFIEAEIEEMNYSTNTALELIDKQIAEVNESLSTSGKEFSDFRSRKQTINPGAEATAVFEQRNQLEGVRSGIKVKLDYFNSLKFYMQNRDSNKDIVAPSLTGFSDNALNSRINKLNELYGRREVLSYSAQEQSPVMKSLDNEIGFARQALIENIDNLVRQAEIELASADQRLNAVSGRLADLPRTEQDLTGIKRNYDLNNQLYTFLLQKRAEAEIAKAANRSEVKIVDPAAAEIALLVSPKLLINLLVGLLAGAFLSIAWVSAKTWTSGVLLDESEVAALLHSAPAGSIVERKYKDKAVVLSNPRSSLAESLRGLRINIDQIFRSVNGKAISVHAFVPGAGKSFVSLNLALMYAGVGKKTVLLDGDLRKPTLHAMLGVPVSGGFHEYLEGQKKMSEIIQATRYESLKFIPAGETSAAVSEHLNEKAIAALLDHLRKEFEVIVVDNSPFDIVHDARLIAEHVDVNLFLLRVNHSTRQEVRAVNQIGDQGQLSNVMVAINGRKYKKGYGYGYYVD
ncbi:MAG: GumC family protein, partial [Bacteroidota bacterium]